MPTTRSDLDKWFRSGLALGATHMIVVVDTFDYEDYPVYVLPNQSVREKVATYNDKPMQRIMEVYNLGMDRDSQINSYRVFNY